MKRVHMNHLSAWLSNENTKSNPQALFGAKRLYKY